MIVKFKKLNPEAIAPEYKTAGAAAFDLSVCSADLHYVEGSPIIIVGTGIAIEIPTGYFCQVSLRSSAARGGLMLANGVGVIDSDYRGEIKLLIHGSLTRVRPGDRIAQGVILPVPTVLLTEVEELSGTDRGDGGFGSTGRR